MRLLLIEDNEQLSQLLTKELEAAGRCRRGDDRTPRGRGSWRLPLLARSSLTSRLPDGDGIGVLRELRGRRHPTRY